MGSQPGDADGHSYPYRDFCGSMWVNQKLAELVDGLKWSKWDKYQTRIVLITLKVLKFWNSLRNGVGGSLDSYSSLKPLWSGMGVGEGSAGSYLTDPYIPHPLPMCCNYPV